MEVLTIVLLALILLTQLFISWGVLNIEKWLAILTNIEPEPKPEEAKVTDPFTKPKQIYSSTNHIVVPKTPLEILQEPIRCTIQCKCSSRLTAKLIQFREPSQKARYGLNPALSTRWKP